MSQAFPVLSTQTTDQAESVGENPLGASTQTRILIELQVISNLLAKMCNETEDLALMRHDISASLLSYR